MQQIFQTLCDWQSAGSAVTLAVVTKTWGSAPRRAGSLMAIAADGRFEGSVSGGCVEGDVIAEAGTLAQSVDGEKGGGSKKLSFTVSSKDAWQVGLACGGEIEITLVALPHAASGALQAVIKAIDERGAGIIGFDLATGAAIFGPGTMENAATVDATTLRLRVQANRRMAIVGAVHIAQHLCPMAVAAGYDVTVIDPRAAFVENRAFDGATTVTDWPDDYFSNNPLDHRSALVTLTHDPKIDDAALMPALGGAAFYIGCLGSRKTHAARLGRLEKAGMSPEQLSRIHGPVGLNIGAKNPAEIAISILAQVTQALRQKNAA